MTILLTIAFGLTGILVSQVKTIRNIGYSVAAFYAAETGIETALASSSCRTSCSFDGILDLGGGNIASYSVLGSAPGGSCAGEEYCLKSVGNYGQTKRGIQIAR